MTVDRRTILQAAAAGVGLTSRDAAAAAAPVRPKRIATEEGFMTRELLDAQARYYATSTDADRRPPAAPGASLMPGGPGLTDWDIRLREMDEAGVDMQVLLVGSPGLQVFGAAEGTALSRSVNDEVAAQCRARPSRFAFLAGIAPQSPTDAAKEFERAVTRLGARGAIINSHTKGEYLDDPKFMPIFEAAVALDVPIYIHPRDPSPQMLQPYQAYPGLSGAMWGYAAETGLHALRLILSGLFDRMPKLRIVLGHAGESIPFTLDRIDNRYKITNPRIKLQKLPSAYFLENFYVTTSGINWAPTVRFCQDVLGADRVMFAIDYPFEDNKWSIAEAEKCKMTPSERFAFYQGVAERVFKIKA